MLKIVENRKNRWRETGSSRYSKKDHGQQQAIPEESLSRLSKLANHVRLMSGKASPSVMLLGLSKKNTVQLYRPFAELGWQVLPEQDTTAGLAYLQSAEIDIVVLDLRHDEVYSPVLISKIRAAEPDGRRCKIVGLGQSIAPHLVDQMFEAGVDMILPGHSPKL